MTLERVLISFVLLERLGYPLPRQFTQGTPQEQGNARAKSAEAWLLVIGDRTDDELREAVLAYTRTPGAKWWPTPADLLEHMTASPADVSTDPGLVFDAILDRIRGGTYGVADLLKTKQLSEALERIGGTWRLRTITEEEVTLVRKRYIEAARRAPKPAAETAPALERKEEPKQLPPPPPIEFDLEAWRARRAQRLAAEPKGGA